MKVAVVGGCGAVGSAVTVALALAGADVAVVARRRSGCHLERVTVEGLGEAAVKVCGWDAAPGLEPEVVVYATKAYDLEAAVEASLNAGWSPGLVVSMQNGLGSLEQLERVYGSSRAVAALAFYGVYRPPGSCHSRLAGRSRRVVVGCRAVSGQCSPSARLLVELLLAGGLDAEYVADIEPYRWAKLAVNAAVNPVTVIAWDRNRVVVENPYARQLAVELAAETGRAAAAAGVELPVDPVEEALRVADATGDNCSSMLQDVAAGRRTEIDYINGAVWRTAEKHGAQAPVNKAVYNVVRLLEPWLAGRRSPCATY
ncbi:ketopantoate reductase [Pyrodictium delaneyi]|uniref:2-dehydropantoate 2-reductase n=1 Tax=Pyrodictium delaneyi TaxID=1273541 RepID=A0A0P0N3Y3_9CREN|nr:ketopantoate reductase family protein [Pyrodictium delaneyi]ALL00868.1 ketopantoate reductase [Pyrodictium delaneyi]OWJ55507.1 hypothetical protein Pdsh_01555 [Pyrodictium delaneyi]